MKEEYFRKYGPNNEPYDQYYRRFFNAEKLRDKMIALGWKVNSFIDFGAADGSTIRDLVTAGVPNVSGYELQLFEVDELKCDRNLWHQGDAKQLVKTVHCDVAYVSFLMYFTESEVDTFIKDLHKCVNVGAVFQNLFRDDAEDLIKEVSFDPMRVSFDKLLTKDQFRKKMQSAGFFEASYLDFWKKN